MKKVEVLEAEMIQKNLPGIDLAVMGCAVNGPGEASHADIGVACGDGKGVIFKKGKIIDTVKETEIESLCFLYYFNPFCYEKTSFPACVYHRIHFLQR